MRYWIQLFRWNKPSGRLILLIPAGWALWLTPSAPPSIFLFGLILLGENQGLRVWAGILLVTLSLIGIALRKTEPLEDKGSETILLKGYLFAFLSVIFAVVAASLSRLALKDSVINPFQSTEIRLLGSLLLLGSFNKINLNQLLNTLSFESRKEIIYATFLGTNTAIFLQQYVFQNKLDHNNRLLLYSFLVVRFPRKHKELLQWHIHYLQQIHLL